jgi:hypothetical protein
MLVYHFLNQQYGLESLQFRRLKVSLPDNLNDPFEHRAIELSDKVQRRAFNDAIPQLAKLCGLICFSEAYSSPMIWCHYADRHKGMCLGFEIPKSDLTQVRYVPKRLRGKIGVSRTITANEAKLALKLATYKHSEWSYEREWRAFVALTNTQRSGELYFLPYAHNMVLREVVMGANSTASRQQVDDALGDLGDTVRPFKARPAFKTFKMTPNKMERLWT